MQKVVESITFSRAIKTVFVGVLITFKNSIQLPVLQTSFRHEIKTEIFLYFPRCLYLRYPP